MSDDEPSEGAERHVLLVEDNPGDVRLTQEAFDAGTTDTALHDVASRSTALAFLRQEGEFEDAPRPDLVLLDLNFPKGNGFEVLEAVKGDDALRRIPVLVLTSSDSPDDVTRSYDLHANAYLTKPVDPEAFVSLARTIEAFWFGHALLPPE